MADELAAPSEPYDQIDLSWAKAKHEAAVEHVLTKVAMKAQSRAIYRAYVIEDRPISEKAFAVLARCISRIYTRIDSGGDIIDCVLDYPMIPDAGNGSYSYKAAATRMRELLKQCVKLTIEQAITSLPETFRECTWLFCDACGKDQKNRWNLLCLYNDLIADMWGCAKALSGSEDTGESEA